MRVWCFLYRFTDLFLLRETPQELGLQPDGNASPADESRAVPATDADIGLTANRGNENEKLLADFGSFALIGIGITSILAHLVPLLIGRGISPATAAMCMSSLSFGLIFGRIFAGF